MSIGAAKAADMSDDDVLRGSFVSDPSPGFVRWDGLQAGVQIGLSGMNTDFGNSTSGQVAYILRNTTIENEGNVSGWTTLPSNNTNGRTYGLFLGYNMQWSELVVGFDLAYNRMSSLQSTASDTMSRVFNTSDGYTNTVTVSSQASLEMVDYGTLRAKAGYAIGQFLPYAVIGAAVGRFNYTTSARVTAQGVDPTGVNLPYGPSTGSDSTSKNNAFAIGFVGGLGLDVAILPNVFLRAEYEYIAFAPLNGIRANLNTGRVGAGVRF